MLVTVLITFYSKESGLLINAVCSSLSQSYKNIELLIIDDCSFLKASDELKNLDDDRIRIYRNENNIGMANSINKGLRLAKGEVVAFLDYDDVWYQNKLEEQVANYRIEDSDKAIIYTMARIKSRGSSYTKPKVGIKQDERVSDYLFCNDGLIQTSGILMNTQTARKIGMDDFRRHTDYQFCLSAEAQDCYFRFIDTILYEHIVIPKVVDYNLSIKWLDTYRDFFTTKAISSFKSSVILKLIIGHGEYKRAFKYCRDNHISLITMFKSVSSKLIKAYAPTGMIKMITTIKNSR
ncbi:glycosyltransferase family 2 protein [Vibrio kanaloae]|uniref:glycosyltransferase family 2 protein n=1 Tax=Vibrio kanaloae TaxID=170673 RepID=UPI001EFCE997|nr:glycosyltransferase family 2 protein [Vibrio kanaloae]MCG9559369.1 glycosyltransferase family 2 protein [Vibrio kanaloae]